MPSRSFRFMFLLMRAALYRRGRLVLILLLAGNNSVYAQEKWTLQNCLDFYKGNNVRVQQQNFAREKARLQLRATRKTFLPVVDARWRSASNWGFLIDPSTNILDRRFNVGNQAVVNASWDLFNGPYASPIVALRTQELAAAEYEYRAAINSASLDILFLYLQALLGHEQVVNARQRITHLQTKQKQIERQVAAGVLHKRDLLNMQFQLSYAAVQVVEAENNLDKSVLTLMQAVGLHQPELITIEAIEVPDSLLTADLDTGVAAGSSAEAFAEVQAARAQVEAAAARISVVRYTKLPVLVVGAQIATRTSNFQKAEFGTQLKNNFNQQAAVSLSVPLFNNNYYQNNLAIARLDMAAAQAAYTQAKEDVRQRIFAALLAYKAAYRKLIAAQAGYRAMLEENRFAEKQLQLGIISAVEYGEVQSRLLTVQSDLLQSKYDCFFKLKILENYKEQPQDL